MADDPTVDVLTGRDLDAQVLVVACGWRWASRDAGLYALIPPSGSDWRPSPDNEAGNLWRRVPWDRMPLDFWPGEDERYADWDGACILDTPGGPQSFRCRAPQVSTSREDALWALERFLVRHAPMRCTSQLQPDWVVELDSARGVGGFGIDKSMPMAIAKAIVSTAHAGIRYGGWDVGRFMAVKGE